MSNNGREVGEALSLIGISYADYLDWRKSLDGCYELMRLMLDIPKFNIFDSVFCSVDDRFNYLLHRNGKSDEEIAGYEAKYEALLKKYEKCSLTPRINQVRQMRVEDSDFRDELDYCEPSDSGLVELEKELERDERVYKDL